MESKKNRGLTIERHFSKGVSDPYQIVDWKFVDIKLKDESGSIIFEHAGVEVPAQFSYIAEQTMVSKYFRMTDVPAETIQIDETNKFGVAVPKWLRRSEPAPNTTFTHESSVKQVIHRLAGFWTYWGWMSGYFISEDDARAFYDECVAMLVTQRVAPNTPQWFNAGLNWSYGIKGPDRGFWKAEVTDDGSTISRKTKDSYTNPGLHACFIFSVADEMFGTDNEPGIYQHLINETRAFVTGGGSGANYSSIRSAGEMLSTGARATGLKSFLEVLDRSAGVIKSGSSSRRAAKMIVINLDHPEIKSIINWKREEEKKVEVLISSGYDGHFEGEAYKTVSGQNGNITVRVPTAFLHAVSSGGEWELTARTTGEVVATVKAKELWDCVTQAALECGDPGVQFEDTISDWDTCPNDSPIVASNPCSEYLFKNDSACNLAALNVQKFIDLSGKVFDVEAWKKASAILTIVLDISIEAGQLPTKLLAEGTVKYRTIGLGHTGIGAALMTAGIPYNSDNACNFAAAITSLMTSEAYKMSAIMAKSIGQFPRYTHNAEDMLGVLRNHALAASGNPKKVVYSGISSKPYEIKHNKSLPKGLGEAVIESWEQAIGLGESNGYRNAFVSLIQPSGTVGLIMDCDTTALEPDYSIVKRKFLSGGGSMKIVNGSLEQALVNMRYTKEETSDMMAYVLGHSTLRGAPHINMASLEAAGVTESDIDVIESKLHSATSLKGAFVISKESAKKLGIKCLNENGTVDCSRTNPFKAMGFTREQYAEADKWICGHGTFEGAPHIKEAHAKVFLTANKSGWGEQYLPIDAKLNMVAACSPYISGGISCTFNLPRGSTSGDVDYAFRKAHDLGIKCVTVYVDGSKKFQPLVNPSDMDWWDSDVVEEAPLVRGQRKKPTFMQNGFKVNVTIYGESRAWKIWIHFYEYPDGEPCEVWVDVSEEDSKYLEWWGRAVSNAIQYGQPLEELASSYLLSTGGPHGATDHPNITYCTSIPDLVFKLMLMHYRGETQWCKTVPKPGEIRMNILRQRVMDAQKPKEEIIETKTVVYKSKHNPTRCPKCGSTDLVPYPCPTCARCGHSLGGCSA